MDTLFRFGAWVNRRSRPVEGWLAVFLMLAAIFCVVGAVLDVGWVAEDGVVIPAALLGAFLGLILAKRPLKGVFAWLLILIYLLLVTAVYLGNLFPPLSVLLESNASLRQFWLQNGGFFLDRMGSWLIAVFQGGISQETIVFAFILGLGAGLIAAYALWTTFRLRKPLLGLALLGFLLAINSYYGDLEIWWLAGFVGVMVLVTAVLHFTNLEQKWRAENVDYSDQLYIDLLLYATVIAALLITFSVVLPSFRLSKIQDAFAQLTAVAQTEETVGRAFAGVQQPRRQAKPLNPGRIGGEGVLPRNYLLGLAPELAEIVMMTTTVRVQDNSGTWEPAPAELLRGTHWRALTYQDYTGRGWVLSEERREEISAFAPIEQSSIQDIITLKQQVYWQRDERVIRYSLGLPLQFDQDTISSWRGLDDLVRVWGEGDIYEGETRLSVATAGALRDTAVSDIPGPIIARYTDLPDTVPQRVHDLAQEVAGEYTNPYDQARAIERFLRQYPYTLSVSEPPVNVDSVDYFLFDLQRGYCDYYASSMVVMARSLGLPARMAVGFLGQTPDENGVQTIRQINGHSWAEVYFAGYGWIEFEPTGAFASPRDVSATFGTLPEQYIPQADGLPEDELSLPTIPERDPVEPFPWSRVVILAGFFVVLVVMWWQKRKRWKYPSQIEWAYANLQREVVALGQPISAKQTPHEFTQATLQHLDLFTDEETLKSVNQTVYLQRHVQRLSDTYENYQYAADKIADGEDTAVSSWESVKRPLRLLRIKQILHKIKRK